MMRWFIKVLGLLVLIVVLLGKPVRLTVCRYIVLNHKDFGRLGLPDTGSTCGTSRAFGAYTTLVKQGDVEFFRELAGSDDPVLAMSGLSALKTLNHPEADQMAAGSLRDRSPMVAKSAILCLTASRRSSSTRILERTVIDSSIDEETRGFCSRTLALERGQSPPP